MKQAVLVFCALLVVALPLFSQNVTKVGTTAAGFLNIDVGARAIGMGGAYVAVSDDAMSMYWNAAGISRINGSQAVFTHNRWLADIAFNYAGFAMNLGNLGAIGLNAQFMTMDKMERTTIMEPDGTGELFSAGSYAFGLAYGRNLTDRFSIGFNFKYLREEIYHSSASGIAFDIGTLFDTQYQGLKIGMSISNYGTKMRMEGRDMLIQTDIDPSISGNNYNINANLATDAFDLPLMFRVGVSMDVLKGLGNSNLILAVDALHPNDDVEYVNVGAEYTYGKMFSLRGGYKTLFARDSEQGLCFGAGINYSLGGMRLMLDYAYQDFGVLKEIQMFTVALGF
ncbi:MAG: PorV/PorQ family protein [candidate division KSB1 bacterium]|nr:PorV/PorQ family protein [candidate division KSB1 bacterium]MDZ7345751.1 PorV/PorQ family protein [candidate division KSB1 bacterium]